MILVDTSIWVDHLRTSNAALIQLLDNGAVLAHPWVTGELALGNLSHREEVIWLLRDLPQASVADDDEILRLIEGKELFGAGIGYVDAQLLSATKLSAEATLWSNDRRLSAAAVRLGVDFQPFPLTET